MLKSVATLSAGTAIAQAATIVAAPLIARLYGPVEFGIQSVVTSLVGVASTVAALGYPIAIVLPKSDADAMRLAVLSMWIGVVVSLIATAALFFFGNVILPHEFDQFRSGSLLLIPLSLMTTVMSTVIGYLLARERLFAVSAFQSVSNGLIANGMKIMLGFMNPTAVALISSNIVSGAGSSLYAYRAWRKQERPPGSMPRLPVRARFLRFLGLARKYRNLPLLRAPQDLINAISQSMPIVLLATFFGPSASGQYALAISILGVPSNLVATAVMTVLYPTVTATIQSGNKASRLLLKSTLWMAIAGTVPFVFIAFFGKAFFTFVFGAGWAAAGSYAQLLSVWLFFQFINKPVVSAVPALKLERGLLLYECASSASKALALAAGFYLFKSDIVAIGMFSASGVAAYLFLIVWILRRAR